MLVAFMPIHPTFNVEVAAFVEVTVTFALNIVVEANVHGFVIVVRATVAPNVGVGIWATRSAPIAPPINERTIVATVLILNIAQVLHRLLRHLSRPPTLIP